MSRGGPVIDREAAANLHIAASADRSIHSIGTTLSGKEAKMSAINVIGDSERYARCIQSSKKVRWDIDKDVIRGRVFDAATKFLPDGLSLAEEFTTLSANEKRFVSQIQGRTYANV